MSWETILKQNNDVDKIKEILDKYEIDGISDDDVDQFVDWWGVEKALAEIIDDIKEFVKESKEEGRDFPDLMPDADYFSSRKGAITELIALARKIKTSGE
jgi:hypothetical protein